MARDHGPQIKDDEQYEALRRQGAGKQTPGAHRQHRARGGRPARRQGAGLRGLEKDELYQRAKELDIEQRSGMSKDELIDALRDR
jgi:hypothetical protein